MIRLYVAPASSPSSLVELEVPITEGRPLVTYKYELESEDLSSFTVPYTTSINLPKTHTNLKAFNFPDTAGFVTTSTVDNFVYAISDTETSFTDSGRVVISSVDNDNININLYSGISVANAALSDASYPSADSTSPYYHPGAYTNSDDTTSDITPSSAFIPASFGIQDGGGLVYHDDLVFWNNNSVSGDYNCFQDTTSKSTSKLFHYGIANIGAPNNGDFDASSIAGVRNVLEGGIQDFGSPGTISFLTAPAIDNFIYAPDDPTHQYRWYHLRTLVPFLAIVNNITCKATDIQYTISLTNKAKQRLRGLYYVGPTLADLTGLNPTQSSTRYNFSFTAETLTSKLEKPWTIIKRVFKEYNIRIIPSANGIQGCTTDEYYTLSSMSQAVDLSGAASGTPTRPYLDYTDKTITPFSYGYSHIIFQGKSIDAAWQKKYTDLTGYEYNRGVYLTGYPVHQEKNWFGDPSPYSISPTVEYSLLNTSSELWDKKYTLSDIVEACDKDGAEVDIAGIIVHSPASSLKVRLLGDATITPNKYDPYKGFYITDHLTNINLIVLFCTADPTTIPCINTKSGASEETFGIPKYVPTGTSYTNVVPLRFPDIVDSFSSSLCTLGVCWDNVPSTSSLGDVTRRLYWFDNHYWVVFNLDSYAPGSHEYSTTTFLRVNDVNAYLPQTTGFNNSITCTHGTLDIKVNGITASADVTQYGDVVSVVFTPSSGYAVGTMTVNGVTTQGDRITFTSTEDMTIVFTPEPALTITATAGEHGSVSPTSITVARGGSATLIAVPDDDYRVYSWTDNGVETITDDAYYAIRDIQVNHTISVSFISAICQLTVQAYDGATTTPDAGGTISFDGETYARHLTAEGVYGESVTIVQRPDSGYRFDHWATSGGAYISSSDTLTIVYTAQAASIRAVFWPVGTSSYTLILTSGEGVGNTHGFGTYAAGAQVPIDCELYDGYVFDGWYDGDTRITTQQSYTYEMPASNKTLQARATGTGQIVLNFRGYNCTCSPDRYVGDPGTTVQVTVSPTSPYEWGSWNDGDTSNPRTFTAVTSQTYTATCYEPQSYTLTFEAGEGGVVSRDSFTGHTGDTVQVTATATDYYEFYQWDDGVTSNPRTFTVGAISKTYTALFQSTLVTLTCQGQNCDCYPATSTVTRGTQVEVNVAPFPNYVWSQWDDGDTHNPRTFTVTDDIAYTASCVLSQKYTLTLDYTGPEGMPAPSLSGAGQYYPDTPVRISSTIPSGYKFIGWYRGATLITTTRDVYITKLASNETITAHFDEDREVLYTFSAEHGYCSPNAYQGWPGDTVEVTVVPDEFYHFVEWDDHSALNPRTFTIGETDVDWVATCGQDAKYHLYLDYEGPTGMPAPTLSGAGDYFDGEAVRISSTIPSGYAFIGWYRGETLISTTRSIYITKLGADETITAHFREDREIEYTFNAVNGVCSPNFFQGWPGDSVRVTVTADQYYSFSQWNDGNTENPRTFTLGEEDKTYTATCVAGTKYQLNLTYTGPSGMPAPTLTGAGQYFEGQSVQISTNVPTGYGFTGWYKGSTLVSTARSIYITKLASTETYTAHFSASAEIVLTFNGVNGTCSPSSFHGNQGDTVEVYFYPVAGYAFTQWNDGDIHNPRTFTVGTTSESYTATAVSSEMYNVSTHPYPSYAGTTYGDGTYATGSSVTITAVPASGCSFLMWYDYGAGEIVSYSPEYTFTMEHSARSFEARFSTPSLDRCMKITPTGTATIYRSYVTGSTSVDCKYSYDGVNWSIMPSGQPGTPIEFSQPIYVKGNNPSGWSFSSSNNNCFAITGSVSISGSVMSLIDNGLGTQTFIPCSGCFQYLFATNSNTSISVSSDFLPATTLTPYCYYQMFRSCSYLTSAPALPATTLAQYCYYGMFYGCTSLTGPISISATSPYSSGTTSACTQMFTNAGTASTAGGAIYVGGNVEDWNETNAGIDLTHWTVFQG